MPETTPTLLPAILVCGDVAMDWLDIPVEPMVINSSDCEPSHCQNWRLYPGTKRMAIGGGAYLLKEIIKKALGDKKFRVFGPVFNPVEASDPKKCIQSYVRLARYKINKEDPGTWRISDFLGYDGPDSPTVHKKSSIDYFESTKEAQVLVIDDAANGFRIQKDTAIFSSVITSDTQVVYKISRPLDETGCKFLGNNKCDLRKKILDLKKERGFNLVVVLDINDLRAEGAAISHSLSWERLAWDVLHFFSFQIDNQSGKFNGKKINRLASEENHNRPDINNRFLTKDFTGWIIIRVGMEGSIIIPPGSLGENSNEKIILIYHPEMGEGDVSDKYRELGRMTGYSAVYTAAIATALANNKRVGIKNKLINSVKKGLVATSRLLKEGYYIKEKEKEKEKEKAIPDSISKSNNRKDIAETMEEGYPVEILAGSIRNAEIKEFCHVEVPPVPENYHAANVLWSIAEMKGLKGIEDIAKNAIIFGFKNSTINVPRADFGKFVTFDQSEIESYRTIKKLVMEYLDAGVQNCPLSLAVFGKPGSGKSFGVKTVIKSILHEDTPVKVFNLSEFQKPEDLSRAFHIIHDITRDNTLPLIFFDEFDCGLNSEPLGWLKYFLAPMQDGSFNDGYDVHPVGRAIFVFAGGTRYSFKHFANQEFESDLFSKAKGPDFLSRLRGFVDIMGVEPAHKSDYTCIIRRAVLLRSQVFNRSKTLGRNAYLLLDKEGRINTDKGVLQALLKVPSYKNGARSLSAIIESCELSISKGLNKATLPPDHLLAMHVDYKRFMELVMCQNEKDNLFLPDRENLAIRVHEKFCENNEDSSLNIPWSQLAEVHRNQNRYQVDSFIRILHNSGYDVELNCVKTEPVRFTPKDIESLAEKEHERWMKDKKAQGYKHGKKKDDYNKTHPDLLQWSKLSLKTRKKDIDAVNYIPYLLDSVGLQIIELDETN